MPARVSVSFTDNVQLASLLHTASMGDLLPLAWPALRNLRS